MLVSVKYIIYVIIRNSFNTNPMQPLLQYIFFFKKNKFALYLGRRPQVATKLFFFLEREITSELFWGYWARMVLRQVHARLSLVPVEN